jgi:DNA-binding transcriptional LysR family regulator
MDWPERIGRRITPRDLHIFLAVADQGNLSKAADRLAISRPVVSKAITALEHTLGVPLLDRSPRGVEPTLYGRAVLKLAVTVFDDLRQGVKQIEFLADPTAGEVRVGCHEALAAGLVSAAINRLSSKFPKLVFQMEIGDVASLQTHLLRERKCEFAITRMLADAPEPDMDAEVLFHERIAVVAGPRSKWLKRRKIALAELVDEPWILTRTEIEPGAPVFEAFRAVGSDVPRARVLSFSLNLRQNMLATGRRLTIVPGSVIRYGPDHRLFNVLPVKLAPSSLPIAIFTLKNRTLSPAAQLFIACVRELAKPLARPASTRGTTSPQPVKGDIRASKRGGRI